jgi:hypothetical protein
MSSTANARAALLLLTALNFLNYIDRNVLYAVQPLIQKEFHLNDEQAGFLTTAFFICYMVAAPLIVPLADRRPPRWFKLLTLYPGTLEEPPYRESCSSVEEAPAAQVDHGNRRLHLEPGDITQRRHPQL